MDTPDNELLDPRRAAWGSIRGYLYQAGLSVLEWLALEEDEYLVCEGDEDLDRHLLGNVIDNAQHKYREDGFGRSDLRSVLASFLNSYAALAEADARAGVTRRYTLVTNAPPKMRWRRDGQDLLALWQDPDARIARHDLLATGITELLQPLAEAKTKAGRALRRSLAWLGDDDDGRRWAGFIGSLRWRFEAPNVAELDSEIQRALQRHDDTMALVANRDEAKLLGHRLWLEVFRVSAQRDAAQRRLARTDLQDIVEEAHSAWQSMLDTPPARRLAAARKVELLLEPRAFDLAARWTPRDAPSLAKLLTANYEIVRFDEVNRKRELDKLGEWCDSDEDMGLWLWTGPGGSGKTRLFIEWCHRLRGKGWHAGFLHRGIDENLRDELAPLFEVARPSLVVVDYAETRPHLVQEILRRCSSPAERPMGTFRLVLLAREEGSWWSSLPGQDDRLEDFITDHGQPVHALRPLVLSPEHRSAAFETALADFAPKVGPQPGKKAMLPARSGTAAPDWSEDLYERVLYIHMAALLALRGDLPDSADAILAKVLEHERRFWRRRCRAEGMEGALEAMASGLAAVTLAGGAEDRGACEDILRLATTEGTSGERLNALARMLHDLYPLPDTRSGGVEALQPDVLGEQLVDHALAIRPAMLEGLLEFFPLAQQATLVTVLSRLADRRAHAARWLDYVLAHWTEQLRDIRDPLGPALAAAVRVDGDNAVRLQLADACDEQEHLPVALRELAAAAAEEALEIVGKEDRVEQARRVALLGTRLSALGKRDEALAASEKALALYRQLSETRPEAFRPDLARSLNNLGVILYERERWEQALAANEEAVAIWQKLPETRPDDLQPDLAIMLNNLGNCRSAVGRSEEALAASEEAVQIRRQLSETRPEAFLPDLAMSLNNLGNRLSALGRREEALAASEEAVQIRRQLSETRPEAFLPDLAMSLGARAQILASMDRLAEAADSTAEAARALFPFFVQLPAAYGNLMVALCRDHQQHAHRAGTEPDAELLVAVKQVLDNLGGE